MKLPVAISHLAQEVRDAFAPARCIGCLTEGTWYCASCRHAAPPHVLTCIGCKQEQMRGMTCIACREDTPLTGIISAGMYSNQILQRGIEWLKFKGVRSVAHILAGLIIPQLSAIAPIDDLSSHAILVPIPLHSWRSRTRGFNQSEDIARAIGTLCGIQVMPLLTRVHATASQAKLPHDMRRENMEAAFSLNISRDEYDEMLSHKPIVILVDDVATTGATLTSAAHALSPTSGTQVWGAVVAKG